MSTEAIVDAVISELLRRGGFDAWWYDVDRDIRDEIKTALAKKVEQACAVPAPTVESCGAECEVVLAVGEVGGVTDHQCLDHARILVNGFPMCAEHYAEYEADGLVETVASLPPPPNAESSPDTSHLAALSKYSGEQCGDGDGDTEPSSQRRYESDYEEDT